MAKIINNAPKVLAAPKTVPGNVIGKGVCDPNCPNSIHHTEHGSAIVAGPSDVLKEPTVNEAAGKIGSN